MSALVAAVAPGQFQNPLNRCSRGKEGRIPDPSQEQVKGKVHPLHFVQAVMCSRLGQKSNKEGVFCAMEDSRVRMAQVFKEQAYRSVAGYQGRAYLRTRPPLLEMRNVPAGMGLCRLLPSAQI